MPNVTDSTTRLDSLQEHAAYEMAQGITEIEIHERVNSLVNDGLTMIHSFVYKEKKQVLIRFMRPCERANYDTEHSDRSSVSDNAVIDYQI